MSLLVATEDTFSFRVPPVYETARLEDPDNAKTEEANYYLQPVGMAQYRIVGLDYTVLDPADALGYPAPTP